MTEQVQDQDNLHYFESSSMHELYDRLKDWQDTNQHYFLSLNVQQDNGIYCCIALTYPQGYKKQTHREITNYEEDLLKFRRKALKHIGTDVNFDSSVIPPSKVLTIQSKLKKCTTPEEVKAIFDEEF